MGSPKTAADIVLLRDQEEQDPRSKDECRRTRVRVALHRHTANVLVEVGDGVDAVGSTHWHRLDAGKKRARRAELRAAYRVTERLLAEYYDRAIAAERRAVAAEERAALAERNQSQAPTQRTSGARAPLFLVDPQVKEKTKIDSLIRLAVGSTNLDEARNAALSAVKMMVENNLSPKS